MARMTFCSYRSMINLGPGIIITEIVRNMHAFMHQLSFKCALKICENVQTKIQLNE